MYTYNIHIYIYMYICVYISLSMYIYIYILCIYIDIHTRARRPQSLHDPHDLLLRRRVPADELRAAVALRPDALL